MMYYIDTPHTWGPANEKCRQLHNHIRQFSHCLVGSQESLDSLVREIQCKVEELNRAFPRTKPLAITRASDYISCHPTPRQNDSDAVFAIHFHPVERTFNHARQPQLLEDGGDQ